MSAQAPEPSPGLGSSSKALVPLGSQQLSRKERRRQDGRKKAEITSKGPEDEPAPSGQVLRPKYTRAKLKYPDGVLPNDEEVTVDHLSEADHSSFGIPNPVAKGPPGTSESFDEGGAGGEDEGSQDDDTSDESGRTELLEIGSRNLAGTFASYNVRPKQIQAAWNKIYPLVSSWWLLPLSKKGSFHVTERNKEMLATLDSDIQDYCQEVTRKDFAKRSRKAYLNAKIKEVIEDWQERDSKGKSKKGKSRATYSEEAAFEEVIKRESLRLYSDRYKFPDLWAHILGAKAAISTIERASEKNTSRSEVEKEKKKLVRGIVAFHQTLQRYGIPGTAVMPNVVVAKVSKFVGTPDMRQVFEDTVTQLQIPSEIQIDRWTQAVPKLQFAVRYFRTDMQTPELEAKWRTTIDWLDEQNGLSVYEELPNMGQTFPVDLLRRMATQYDGNDEEAVAQNMELLREQIENSPLPADILEPLLTTIMDETDRFSSTSSREVSKTPVRDVTDRRLSKGTRKASKAPMRTPPGIGTRKGLPMPSVASEDDEEYQAQILRAKAKSIRDLHKGPRAATSSGPEGSSQERGSVSSSHVARMRRLISEVSDTTTTPPVASATATSRRHPHSDTSSTDADDGIAQIRALVRGKESNVIKFHDYSNGTTEYGLFIASRLGNSGDPRYARFVINAGTPEFPHFIGKRASDLGPGGAAVLCSFTDKQVDFDMRKHKQLLKENQSTYLESIGPTLKLPRSEGYNPRPGARTCRQECLTAVKIRAEAEAVWLSRAQLWEFIGKKRTEATLPKLEKQFDIDVDVMKKAKRFGLYPLPLPLGGRRLEESDRSSYPWLFKSGRSLDEPTDDDGDYELDSNVDMDDVDISFASTADEPPATRPFSKRRIGLEELPEVQEDEEDEEL